MHALRPADLPGLHAAGFGRVPLPGRRGDRRAHACARSARRSARCCASRRPGSRIADRAQRAVYLVTGAPVLARHTHVTAGRSTGCSTTGSWCRYAVHDDDQYYRLVTAAFLHVSLLHIAVEHARAGHRRPAAGAARSAGGGSRRCTCSPRSAARPPIYAVRRAGSLPVVGASGAHLRAASVPAWCWCAASAWTRSGWSASSC